MPKSVIDYSNTIIYKIICKDPSITDLYIGHTTNFTQRKYYHKQTCGNINSTYYNLKLYKKIREHGNWSNWKMLIVSCYNCNSYLEAKQQESDHISSFGATLNIIESLPKIPTNNFLLKKSANKQKQNSSDIFQQIICHCGKIFNSRSTNWRHKKTCIVPQDIKKENNLSNNDIIQMLIKENSEFKNMVLDVVKLVQPINTTNNNNNTFNLHLYLNDTCKDAVNLVDFVDSLQVKIDDLEETAHLGYSEGVSRIFINGLNELEVSKRPIHCSDAKRETIYIKDQGVWEKDDTNKSHLTKAIKVVSKKNLEQIFEWHKKYP